MILADLKNKIKAALNLESAIFAYPTDSELGDLSLACFELAKSRHESPAKLAEELADAARNSQEIMNYFQAVKAVGPYLNFFISPFFLADNVLMTVGKEAEKYGFNTLGGSKRVMIEYSNGNTHKEYHVGHLRNISYGDTVSRLLHANGYEVIPVSYINDFGIHVAKTIWRWKQDSSYQSSTEDKGYLLGKCYAVASQLLKDDPAGKEEVSDIMKEIESRSGDNYKLWTETREWSIKYFDSIYQELHIKFAHIFYESEVIDAGLALVEGMKKQGILRLSEGAIIADLEKYGLGVLPVIRSDGTALYPVADLALASEKFQKYNLDESIYVVDVRQSLYFEQLFKILGLMGYRQSLVHLTYDFVTLPGGMMSSRTGNVVTYQELKEQVLTKFLAETAQRHSDWKPDRIHEVALNLTISTIKFEMLKVGADKIITFNIDEAARFDGYTACYLQYGYARLKSIMRKDPPDDHLSVDATLLREPAEKKILIALARYQEIVVSAGEKYSSSEITKYLFELVQLSNDYYHEINILKAESGIKQARLALIKAVAQVLKNGFTILGMEALEEM